MRDQTEPMGSGIQIRIRRNELYHFDGSKEFVGTERSHVAKARTTAVALGGSIPDPESLRITPAPDGDFTFSVTGPQFILGDPARGTFLEATSGASGDVGRTQPGHAPFIDPPSILVDGKIRVSYRSIVAWASAREAVVKQDDGFYLGSRGKQQ